MKLACLIIAIVLFLLAALGIGAKWDLLLVPLGLAFFAGSFLPWRE